MAYREEPESNRLLAALPDGDLQRWRPHLEPVDLKLGQVLYEPNRPPVHAYFPTGAIVSLRYVMGGGASSDFAVAGNEGMVGTSLFLGGGATTSFGSVLIAGRGFRIGARMIRDEFDRSDAVRRLLLRYTQALLTQIAQTAVCNRSHAIDQQVCSWLLHGLDRLRTSDIVVTHELMACVLGVRRESVTETVGRLQAAGAIRCARGHITVLDRAALERRSCECHQVVKQEYARLRPPASGARPADTTGRASPARDRTAGGHASHWPAVGAAFGI